MRITTLALLLLAVWPFSAIEIEAQTSLENTVDVNITPGDDFYSYANGAWLKAAVIPAGKDRWAVRDEINDLTRRQVDTILDDAKSSKPGTLARKVADFRSALLNDDAIETRGIAPLKPALARIDRVGDKLALTRYLGRTMHADVDPLNIGIYTSSSVLGLSVEHSIHGETSYTPFLLQGGLGLGDRDKYLSKDPEERTRYQKYIAHLLALAGFDRADERAASVFALETAIAETQATSQVTSVDRNADNRWTRTDYTREAPGIDWNAFFEAAGLTKARVIVAWQPTAVKGVAALVASQPLDAWKDYLRFHAIDEFANVLPRAFADAAAEMHGEHRTREQQALAITQASMSSAIGKLYAARYFPPAQKARVRRVITNVGRAFRDHVAHAAWLSPESRKIALAKVDALYVGIGYPEAFEDWSTFQVSAKDPLGNLQRIVARNRQLALARLTRSYDPHEWVIPPHMVGAVLVFQQNAYTFAAALLQAPKYDPTSSDAATYGAIGAIIGHDMSHFVDVLGADYQPNGDMRRWWTADDMTKFEAAAAPLERQFSDYEPLPGQHIDGHLTRTENVADLAGLTAAFDAYRKAFGPKATRQTDREFFIAFAQAFRAKLNERALRAQLKNDHAPEMYRFDTVRNLDAWYETFDVVPGQRLYVAPEARVHIW